MEIDNMSYLKSLAEAVELKCDNTGNHLRKVRFLTVSLARSFAVNLQDELVGLAASLHDIGKVGIPDDILLKPGRLTKEEFEIMKTHTVIGARFFNKSNSVHLLCAQVVLSHHERFDGAGYPNGLSGKNIPFLARLIAIVDVFDALTSVRVYKEAYTIPESLKIMETEMTGAFDPDIFAAFVKLIEEKYNLG